jgi:hypothetical protein
MKWLKRKLRNWIREIDLDPVKGDCGVVSQIENRPDTDPIMNFRVYSAENGKILEFNRYDHAKDRNRVSMYIIDKDEDVSEKVSKCLSLELMK